MTDPVCELCERPLGEHLIAFKALPDDVRLVEGRFPGLPASGFYCPPGRRGEP